MFNLRPRALIFLGDGGSHFLGFFLAAFAFLSADSLTGRGVSLLAYVILLMPFWYDVTFTLGKRLAEGKDITQAHREHLYQRLMICGLSHMRVLTVCAMTYLACGWLAIACVLAPGLAGRLAAFGLGLGLMGLYTMYVFGLERKAAKAI